MINRNQQGNVTVRELDGLIRVEVEAYLISVQATITKGDILQLLHEPLLAPNYIKSQQEALEFGMVAAKEKWKNSEGFANHSVSVNKTVFTFDLAGEPTS